MVFPIPLWFFAMSLMSLRNCLGRVWVGFCQKQECKLSLPLLRGMIIYFLFIYNKMDCLHIHSENAIVSYNVNFAAYYSLVSSWYNTSQGYELVSGNYTEKNELT